MNSPDNVVSFPDASRRKLHSEADKVRHKLIAAARLDHAAIPMLATNLGRMAHRLDAVNPKNGAKSMFKAAFPDNWESVWRKRHRLVRLPGEPTPAFDMSGQYEAAGAKYLHLADAFASLKSPGDQSARDAAVNALTRDTIYSPRSTVSGSQDELTRIIGALRSIAQRIGQSGEVDRAFSILRKYPIEHTESGTQIGAGIEAGITDMYLIAPTHNWDSGVHWALPYVEIGHIDFPIVVPCIGLGPVAKFDAAIEPEVWAAAREHARKYSAVDLELAEACPPNSDPVGEGRALERARGVHGMAVLQRRLAELGVGETPFTLDEFDPDYWAANEAALALPYQLKGTIFARFNVGICAWPSDRVGGVDVRVVGGAHENWNGPDLILSKGDIEENIAQHCEFRSDNRQACFVIIRGSVYAVPSFDMVYSIAPHLIAGPHDLASDEAHQILMHGGEKSGAFRPIIWDDRSRLVPAPHLSVAATILRNLAFGTKSDRIDELLLADAHRRLKPVIQFYEEQILAFEDAADF